MITNWNNYEWIHIMYNDERRFIQKTIDGGLYVYDNKENTKISIIKLIHDKPKDLDDHLELPGGFYIDMKKINIDVKSYLRNGKINEILK